MLFVKPSIHSKLPATSQATQLQNRAADLFILMIRRLQEVRRVVSTVLSVSGF